MSDVYATIASAAPEMVERLADVLEIRAAEPRQAEIRREFIGRIDFPDGSRALEIGCGTGVVCRDIAALPEVAEIVGVDPSGAFVELARRRAAKSANLSFLEADGRRVPLPDGSFDVVVFYTTLCHVPAPEQALAEAFRLLKPGGLLAALDGDYSTTSVGTDGIDPLQACAEAAVAAFVHDPWLARRLPTLALEAGFVTASASSHGYVGVEDPGYLLTLVDRGADALVASGRIGGPLAEALKAEARSRAAEGRFFGHIAYFSLYARKRAPA